jgi:hypothetical protein
MKPRVFAFTVLIAIAATLAFWRGGSEPSQAVGVPDNRGTEFILGFAQNYTGGTNLNFFIGSDVATTATVEIPGIGFGPTAYPVAPGAITNVSLPVGAEMFGSGTKESKGILVTAPDEIFIYGLDQQVFTTDAYLGLPTDIQGTDYVIPTYFNLQGVYPSQLAIVGIQDNTTVTITPSFNAIPGTDTPAALPAGTPFNITLNRLQTFQLKDAAFDSSGDLTGSTITSDKPISVFGAHECAYIPVNVAACDHLIEQVPPTSTWGKEFLTVPLATRTGGDIFRIIAGTNGTNVTIDGAAVTTLNRGQSYETTIPSSQYSSIVTSEPALVVQFSQGSQVDSVTSDPFMMMLPPTGQFASAYTFSTPDSTPVAFNNYVNIVAPTAELAGIQVDGAAVATTWTAIGASGYSGTQVPVSIGTHRVTHTSPIVSFGIYAYGFADYDSYGYPGGMRLAPIAICVPTPMVPADGLDNDCDSRIDEELPNGIDDDGDTQIDEDLAVAPAEDTPTSTATATDTPEPPTSTPTPTDTPEAATDTPTNTPAATTTRPPTTATRPATTPTRPVATTTRAPSTRTAVPTATRTPERCADVTHDGRVTWKDVAKIAKHLGKRHARYDINGDGRVTWKDVWIAIDQLGRRC